LLTEFENERFLMAYGLPQYLDIVKTKGLYAFFVSNRQEIKDFLHLKSNYSINIGKRIKQIGI